MNRTRSGCPPLKNIYLYLSGQCNLRCRHCWIDPDFRDSDAPLAASEMIDIASILKAVDRARTLGLRSVKISGGEPFLHPGILDLLRGLKQRKLNLIIETNATLIGEKQAVAIRNAEVQMVAVSLDGPSASLHEELRGVPGSFQAAIDGIGLLRRHAPKAQIQVIMSMWRNNISALGKMRDLAVQLGASSLKINSVASSSTRAARMAARRELLTVREVLDAYDEVRNWPGNSLSVYFDIPSAFVSLARYRDQPKCCDIKSTAGILGDGSVSFCGIGRTVPELIAGNIAHDDLVDIWRKSPLFASLRSDLPDKLEGICGECVMRNMCQGYCRAASWFSSRSMTAPYDFCEQAQSQGLFPRNRRVAHA